MYDVIVVGARCAGSPLAMNLARDGHRVLVVDRATFPSDTLSTHAIGVDGVPLLRKWGLLDRICAADGSKVHDRVTMSSGGQTIAIPGESFAPRRTVLDKILVDAAREAGADVREGASVTRVLRDAAGAVNGVQLQSGGVVSTEEARVVVGADGRNSFVAREVGAEKYDEKEALACAYYSYFTGFPVETNELWFADSVACGAFPTSHGQVCLFAMQPLDAFKTWREDIARGFQAVFEAAGAGEQFSKATRVEEWRGSAELPNYYRKPYGPGWALVGDAGYIKDPVLGQGVNDAFRDAGILSGKLHAVLTGEEPYEAAMAAYEAKRNAVTAPVYAFNHEFSKLKVTPMHLQQLQAAAQMRIASAQQAAG